MGIGGLDRSQQVFFCTGLIVSVMSQNASMFAVPLCVSVSVCQRGLLTVRIWQSTVTGVAFHPEDRVVASCSEDKSIKLWNLDDGGLLSTMSCDSPVLSIDWHANRIVAGCYDGTIKVFDAQSGDCLSTVRCDSIVFQRGIFAGVHYASSRRQQRRSNH